MKQSYKKARAKSGGFQHKHSLGQNFLTDVGLLESLIDETGVGPEDHILEIGPGGGDMTRLLAGRCKTVTAVELDQDLIPILRVVMEKAEHFTLVQGDILRVNLPEIMAGKMPFHVVANIPYYLTTELLTLLLSSGLPIRSVNVMVQKEAAQRVLAAPSTPEYGPLAIRARYIAQPRLARIVEAACFTPPPKVDSAFLCMPWRDAPAVQVRDEKRFFKIVNAAFALRRKTLCNNLISAFHLSREEAADWLKRANLSETIRGEALTLQQFADLANAET
ncbi:MAG: ribosomal RNA small subunit methyltransferase A [Clostridia bacterium]|nr:ribosomal RNA small subunit methyltransferase A [Clostridia bacterium]